DVDTALVQVGDHLPDGAVALAGGQRNVNRLLEALEHLDVAGNRGLLDEQNVIRFEGAGELDEGGRRHGTVGVEHDRAVGADLVARRLDGLYHAVDVGGIAGMLVDAVRRHFLGLGRVIDADAIAARAAEQAIDRHAPQLAGDVPAGHVEAREGVHHEGAAAYVTMRPVDLLPQVFDARRVLAVEYDAQLL